MNSHLASRVDELKQMLGPLFYRCAIPGGLMTVWATDDGWTPIAIPDREQPLGHLRQVPIEGSNRFTYRIHYPDEGGDQAGAWAHLIASANDG